MNTQILLTKRDINLKDLLSLSNQGIYPVIKNKQIQYYINDTGNIIAHIN